MMRRIGFATEKAKALQDAGIADFYGTDERVREFITTENFLPNPHFRGRIALVDAESQRNGALTHATLLVRKLFGMTIKLLSVRRTKSGLFGTPLLTAMQKLNRWLLDVGIGHVDVLDGRYVAVLARTRPDW